MIDLFGQTTKATNAAGSEPMECLDHCSQRNAKALHGRDHSRALLAAIQATKDAARDAIIASWHEPIRAPDCDLLGHPIPRDDPRAERLAFARRIEAMQRELVRRGVLLMTDRDSLTWCESERLPDRPDWLNNRESLPLFA